MVRKFLLRSAREGPTIRHREHFEALAQVENGSEPAWSVAATLLVLRLTDRVVLEGESVATEELVPIRDAIAHIATGEPIAQPLWRAVASVESGTPYVGLAPALRDVGRVLASHSLWPLAHDVYVTAADAARATAQSTTLLESLLGAGRALYVMQRFDEANENYRVLYHSAKHAGDTRYMLEAKLGLARVVTERGNFPDARRRIDSIIREARTVGCRPVLSKAMHDRGRVAGEMGDFTGALEWSYSALLACDDARERDRILANVARALALVGYPDAARDATLLLAETAQEVEVRIFARINLLEIAALAGAAALFERYRQELSTKSFAPVLTVRYYEAVGDGCRVFGRVDEARVAYQRMLALSETHRLAEQTITAERALAMLSTPQSRTEAPAPSAPSEAVRPIADAITEMRVRAGVRG